MAKSGIHGDRELIQALTELSKGVPVRDIDRAAISSLEPMRDETEANIRRHRNYVGKHPGFPQPDPGRDFVDQGIATRRVKGSKSAREYWMGATRRARSVLHLLEFGTSAHWQSRFRGGFLHPGAKAKPVMTPAYEEHADDVPRRFGKRLWISLEKRVLEIRTKSRMRR